MSLPEWHDLQPSGIFEYVSPHAFGSVNLTGSSQPTRARFSAVAPNYFALPGGVKLELGELLNPEDQTPGFTLEVVISDGLWKRAFAADPGILGKSLRWTTTCTGLSALSRVIFTIRAEQQKKETPRLGRGGFCRRAGASPIAQVAFS